MNNRPTFSIEINPDNIHLYPQLESEFFTPQIIEKFKKKPDPFEKAEVDWFRDNPTINGTTFLSLPPQVTIARQDRRKYLTNKLTGEIDDGHVTTTDGKKIRITSSPLTPDVELNKHFAYIAHQNIMQAPFGDIIKLTGLSWISGVNSTDVITTTDTNIHFTKTFDMIPLKMEGKNMIVGDKPSVQVTTHLEVYRDGDEIKHKFGYSIETLDEEAKKLIEKIFSPTYQLLGALSDSLKPPVAAELHEFIDNLNDIESIDSSELLPFSSDCPWTVVTLLSNLKKLSIELNEERDIEMERLRKNAMENRQFLDLRQLNPQITRINRVNTLYEKVFSEYKSILVKNFENEIVNLLNDIKDPNSSLGEFNTKIKKLHALIENFNLVNEEEISENQILSIARKRLGHAMVISEQDITVIANILKFSLNDESNPYKKTLDLYQKSLMEFVKLNISMKVKNMEDSDVKDCLSHFIKMLESDDMNESSKNTLLLSILDGLLQNQITKVLKDNQALIMSLEAKTLQAACTEFKKELGARIEEIAKTDPSLSVGYFNTLKLPGLVEPTTQSFAETVVQQRKNANVKRLASENTEFKVLLDKYESITTVQIPLERNNIPPKDAKEEIPPKDVMEEFKAALLEHKKTIKKSEDGPTLKFLKIVATVLSFGAAYDKLWKTKGDEFYEKVGTLFSSAEKRKRKYDEVTSPEKKPRQKK